MFGYVFRKSTCTKTLVSNKEKNQKLNELIDSNTKAYSKLFVLVEGTVGDKNSKEILDTLASVLDPNPSR